MTELSEYMGHAGMLPSDPSAEPAPDFAATWLRIFAKYKKELAEIAREYPLKKSVEIDYHQIEKTGKIGLMIADDLIENPGKVLEDAYDCLKSNQLVLTLKGKVIIPNVRFTNLPKCKPVRSLRVEDMNTFISIEGIVQKVTDVKPRISEAVFKCPAGHFTIRRQGYGPFVEPESCATDGCNFKKLELITKRSRFVNSQKIRVVEAHDNLRGGEAPYNIDIDITDDLVGEIMVGDRVIINGIYRAIQKVAHGTKSTTFDTHVEANNTAFTEKEFDDVELNAEMVERIKEFAKTPYVLDQIVSSIAPTIYGNDRFKQACALQLFGGVQKALPDETTLRGDIHVLAIGDPATAKSQIMNAVQKMSPRCISTTGMGSTAAGLTAAAVKDEFGEGRWTLEAGAFVLADMGKVIVDELEKMKKDDRASILTAMEQQFIKINKAGINASLRSRCSVLAAANPKFGRFDPAMTLAEQTDLEPPLLSRFDLIFPIRDVPEPKRDRAIAETILKSHRKENDPSICPTVEPSFIKQYVSYARKNIEPELTKDAEKMIADFYVTIRNPKNEGTLGEERGIPATARQCEAIIRLAQASAKARLSNTATIDDAEFVIGLVLACLKEVAYDIKTGTYDTSKITSTVSTSMQGNIKVMRKAIEDLKDPSHGRTDRNHLYAHFKGQITEEEVDAIIAKMSKENLVLLHGNNWITTFK